MLRDPKTFSFCLLFGVSEAFSWRPRSPEGVGAVAGWVINDCCLTPLLCVPSGLLPSHCHLPAPRSGAAISAQSPRGCDCKKRHQPRVHVRASQESPGQHRHRHAGFGHLALNQGSGMHTTMVKIPGAQLGAMRLQGLRHEVAANIHLK